MEKNSGSRAGGRRQTVRNFLLSAIGLPLTAGRYRTGPYSRKQEGSGACGARVLSVMCWRTDRWVLPTERAGSEGSIVCRLRRAPFGGWRHHLARWEACHWILSRLSAPYSTAITDSLDSQVAPAPLRIQFAGVTPVPLPPPIQGALWVLGGGVKLSL